MAEKGGTLCWFDQMLTFRTRSGRTVERRPWEITRDFGGPDAIVGVAARHPYVTIGFRYLMRDVLQIAFAPADAAEWAARLQSPPTPAEIEAALAPYRAAFVLDDPIYPVMQVRPSDAARAAVEKPAARRGAKPVADAEEDDEGSGSAPIAWLLPDAPTKNVVEKDDDFFVKRDPVLAIGAGAILPVLHAHMVLFPPIGGGYFGLPHGQDSLKFSVVGETLWTSIYANVLPRDHAHVASVRWPPACDATVFPWLAPALAKMSLKRGDDGDADHPGSTRTVRRIEIHPCTMPLPRRYELEAACAAACDLTGVSGPAFATYSRWPNGLQYDSAGWWVPFAAVKEAFSWRGNGYVPEGRMRKGVDGVPTEAGPDFLKASGPLRFNHWLGLSLLHEPSLPATDKGKKWLLTRHPEAVAAFQAAERLLARQAGSAAGVSTLAQRSAFRLEAVAAVPQGKALGLLDARTLPLWRANDDAAAHVAASLDELMEALRKTAQALRASAKAAALTASDKSPAIAVQLQDALLVSQDGALDATAQRLFALYADSDDIDAANDRAREVSGAFVKQAGTDAKEMFDATFPVRDVDAAAIRIARARVKLQVELSNIRHWNSPSQPKSTRRSKA